MTKLRKQTHLSANSPQEKKINMSLPGLGSVCIVKNYDLGLENAFLRPRSQFFTIRTTQPANNIYLLYQLLRIEQLLWGKELYCISFSLVSSQYVLEKS